MGGGCAYQRPEFKYPLVAIDEKTEHPTQKPVDLMKDIMCIHSNLNDTILDCFMGSGSTGVAAKDLGRNFIGIELDDHYFNLAKSRIENTEVQIKLF